MKRRTLLVAGGIVLAGCTTTNPDEDTGGAEAAAENESDAGNETEDEETEDEETEDEETEDDDLTDEEIIEQFKSTLEDQGFERVDVEHADDRISLSYDATGTEESDVAAEIELITDGYTTVVEQGVLPTHLEAAAYDPAEDRVLDSFTIETELVETYLSESLEWHELLARIGETFVSHSHDEEPESDDEQDGDNEESEETEDSTGGEETADG
ncbi:hypothetical protein [Halostagnicola sp. A-GB9-2]|uniref:hypothetical protein n=1 Tax=Halostagnicola sp. A-GB9-2 TaxID=3048066 RepID=UPI0024C012E7|nr:hypothetical protein [Halostagnicola sp. A-GB9-2]MDJ1433171.1 hypothetical protein [Halostagnicola sp. A-GB9-2]